MDALLSVNWIALLVLAIALLMFKFLNWIAYKVNWTLVVLISMVIGAVMGLVFASDGNTYLVWTDLIGDIYINLVTAMVAPVILLSVISGLIALNDRGKMKKIGTKSVFWLLFSSVCAIILSLLVGGLTGIGSGAGAVFSEIASVTEEELSAYNEMQTSLDQILLNLFPTNIVSDLSNDNIVAIIIIAVVLAVAYVNVSSEEGEDKVVVFKQFVEAAKKIVFHVLSYVIDLTPYAVLCLTAGAASQLFADREALVQLVLLVALVYVTCLLQSYGINAILLACAAKVNPLKFFKKTFDAQATAFTTQSSIGTLPITIDRLVKKVGVDEEVANFTAPLGTTIGMSGCTCIFPILLAMFYLHATGTAWGASEYLIMCVMAIVLSMGSAGMPGVGVISAVSMFTAVNLPVAAVILMIPINNITDMVRTLTNVTTAGTVATVVGRRTELLDESVFNKEDEKREKEGQR